MTKWILDKNPSYINLFSSLRVFVLLSSPTRNNAWSSKTTQLFVRGILRISKNISRFIVAKYQMYFSSHLERSLPLQTNDRFRTKPQPWRTYRWMYYSIFHESINVLEKCYWQTEVFNRKVQRWSIVSCVFDDILYDNMAY